MAKQVWKAGNMLYPLPVVMVTVRDREGKANIITVAWAGTVCTNPPMLSISVRPVSGRNRPFFLRNDWNRFCLRTYFP